MNLKYKFTKKELERVLKYCVGYALDETKQSRDRTTGVVRSFGGELDANIPGKLLEIATCRILERFCSDKNLDSDFLIHSSAEVGEKKDPDITQVLQHNKKRRPKVFIEIKRHSDTDKWLGPRKAQLKGFQDKWKMPGYMIHCRIDFTDNKNKKQRDITGSILREYIKDREFNLSNFSKFCDLEAEILFAYSLDDLESKGHLFKKGFIIPKTDIETTHSLVNSDQSMRKDHEIIATYTDQKVDLPIKIKNNLMPHDFGIFSADGSFHHIVNSKTKNEYITCVSDVFLTNNIFGKFYLQKGLSYKFFIDWSYTPKSSDDVWFSVRGLEQKISNCEMRNTEEVLKTIVKEI